MLQANEDEGIEFGNSPSSLVAIAKAAHATGDRELERAARGQLEERHGIRITFRRVRPTSQGDQQ